MAESSTNDTLKRRIRQLAATDASSDASCVLYIMSRDQRVKDNAALLAAQKHATAQKLPLRVAFLLYSASGYRAKEHFEFMLDGLARVGTDLSKKNIAFEVRDAAQDTHKAADKLLRECSPAAVYLDFSPLRGPRALKRHIRDTAQCPVYLVDSHNVVPVWVTSDKQEYSARTIRPKVNKNLEEFLHEPEQIRKHAYGTGSDTTDYKSFKLSVKSNGQTLRWKSGEDAAQKALTSFIADRLLGYDDERNKPDKNAQSDLSPYLHFGQLSAQRIAYEIEVAVAQNSNLREDADRYLEELIVRRELSDNFCLYNTDYNRMAGAPEWAQKTLTKHASDDREFEYSYKQFESAQTHDSAWNAAQLQLVQSGKMHGYMRMYWAKKVLEWSESPESALKTLIQLNDFYSIDGGDPNGYVGIMWSVAGVHDRPWGERPVYGTVRSMVYNGLKRKFDIQAYEEEWGTTRKS